MIAAKVSTYDEVCTVIYDDEIYDRITDDNCPTKDKFVMPCCGYEAVTGFVDEQIASLFTVEEDSNMHFMVLKKFRKHADELWRESFKLLHKSGYCNVASKYMSLINFAKKRGFKEVEVVPKAYSKNNKLYDLHILKIEV